MGYIETMGLALAAEVGHKFNNNMGYIETKFRQRFPSRHSSLITIWDILKRKCEIKTYKNGRGLITIWDILKLVTACTVGYVLIV